MINDVREVMIQQLGHVVEANYIKAGDEMSERLALAPHFVRFVEALCEELHKSTVEEDKRVDEGTSSEPQKYAWNKL